MECSCCYDDGLVNILWCTHDIHVVCYRCVSHWVTSQMSSGAQVSSLACIAPSGEACTGMLDIRDVRSALPDDDLDAFEKYIQQQEIDAFVVESGIELDRCPFCNFAVEMVQTRDENSCFTCLNPMCLKESCRRCKFEVHYPLPCNQVERTDAHTKMRVAAEEKMSIAVIRHCPKCKEKGISTSFMKIDGCNKMSCPKCKEFVCYQCNAHIPRSIGYDHFCRHSGGKTMTGCKRCPGKCLLFTSSEHDDKLRVRAAALEFDKDQRDKGDEFEIEIVAKERLAAGITPSTGKLKRGSAINVNPRPQNPRLHRHHLAKPHSPSLGEPSVTPVPHRRPRSERIKRNAERALQYSSQVCKKNKGGVKPSLHPKPNVGFHGHHVHEAKNHILLNDHNLSPRSGPHFPRVQIRACDALFYQTITSTRSLYSPSKTHRL